MPGTLEKKTARGYYTFSIVIYQGPPAFFRPLGIIQVSVPWAKEENIAKARAFALGHSHFPGAGARPSKGSSPILSVGSVPPLACWARPACVLSAPVNVPFPYPGKEPSSKLGVTLAQWKNASRRLRGCPSWPRCRRRPWRPPGHCGGGRPSQNAPPGRPGHGRAFPGRAFG